MIHVLLWNYLDPYSSQRKKGKVLLTQISSTSMVSVKRKGNNVALLSVKRLSDLLQKMGPASLVGRVSLYASSVVRCSSKVLWAT
ncbi:hypothetical protein C5167_023250 [Papaver somniferum]|uniref:Uncharacterized protein n=1 Tax=Papaver somniferum TaxID=3469 RepID=A0A4Y7JP94_PAPSO|nr:hypothetical protein C5167_023250 [Papaver somniferum]